MDPRPRNNQGQFAPQGMDGIDANTTSTAYNPQVIEQRKLSLIEKIRRMRGVRNGVEESVPRIDSNVVNERIRGAGGAVLFDHRGHRERGGVREFSILNKISNLTGMAQIKAGREALYAANYNRSLRDAYRYAAVKQNKFPYRDSDLQYKIESGLRHAAIERGVFAKHDARRARKLINEGVRRRNISIGGIGAVGAGAGAGYLATREKDLSAKLRLRELARQAYDPYAPQPAQPGQGASDFRNAAIGVGALGAGAGVAYAGWRGSQAAKSAQTLTDDALKTSAEARKAARSARVAAARFNRAGKVIKTQLTTFPTFKRVASKIFEEDLKSLKELAAKSEDWRTGGYIGYLAGGYPNALQGIETQQYYGSKGVEYRKRDALKHSAPGLLAAAAAVPVARYAGEKILPRASVLNAMKSGSRIKNVRGKAFLKRAAIIGIPAGAVFGVNALVGGKKQAVPDRAERLKSQEFSNSEYDRLADKNAANNIRRTEYIKDNISSYPLAALGGAGVGLAGGGVLFGKRGVNKKAAILGAAGLLAGRAAMQPKINKWEDRALKREGLLSNAGDDTGLALAKIAPGLAGIAGAIAIAANRSKILKATGNLAKKYRRGAWEVIPAPKGDLPSRAVKGLLI